MGPAPAPPPRRLAPLATLLACTLLLGLLGLLGPVGAQGAPGSVWQGGVVDLRYGQLALDQGGVGRLLITDEDTRWTLNGALSRAEELSQALAAGAALTAIVTSTPDGLAAERVDLFGPQGSSPSIDLRLELDGAPALAPGGHGSYGLSRQERSRLGLSPAALLSVPGLVYDLPPEIEPSGTLRYRLPTPVDLDLVAAPSYIKDTTDSSVYRGPSLTVSSGSPAITSYGPQRLSLRAGASPGWLDLDSAAGLLDLDSITVTASPGLNLERLERRVGRSQFYLRPVGLGTFEVRATATDRLGRKVEKSWWVTVGP